MTINGKAKGNFFERKIAKKLSLWWTNGQDDSVFWRSTSSGAWATQLKKKGVLLKEQSGDIALVRDISCPFINDFYIELKFYKEFKLHNFILSEKDKLYKFWLKACDEACDMGKNTMLIFKSNNVSEMVMVSDISDLHLTSSHFVYINAKEKKYKGYMMKLDDLLVDLYKYYRGVE